MELLAIVRPANLPDTPEQVVLDGKTSSLGRRRRRPTAADQREPDEAERRAAAGTCASQSDTCPGCSYDSRLTSPAARPISVTSWA